MNKVKENLRQQYNEAIECFNKGDYEHYFFHVRKSIELIGKFLIYDILNIKGEIEKAEGIINGSKSLYLDRENKQCNLTEDSQPKNPEGSFFITLAMYTLYYAHPKLYNPENNTEAKRIKTRIDSCLKSMIEYYNTASEIEMHTGNSDLDEKTQANSCAHFFVKAFNDLKSQISDEASAFFLR